MNTIPTGRQQARTSAIPLANTSPSVFTRMAGAVLGVGLLLSVSGAADAAPFGVRVVDISGEPVAGASVCLGLEGNYRQFGTAFTDLDGRATVADVPNLPFVVTVSKTRFAGLRSTVPGRGFSLIRELTLVEGFPGPRCRAGSSVAANPPMIDISDVAVIANGDATTLTPRVSGEPEEYRLGREGGIEDASWQRFNTIIDVPQSLRAADAVVLQLRRTAGSAGASLEARSDAFMIDLQRGSHTSGAALGS